MSQPKHAHDIKRLLTKCPNPSTPMTFNFRFPFQRLTQSNFLFLFSLRARAKPPASVSGERWLALAPACVPSDSPKFRCLAAYRQSHLATRCHWQQNMAREKLYRRVTSCPEGADTSSRLRSSRTGVLPTRKSRSRVLRTPNRQCCSLCCFFKAWSRSEYTYRSACFALYSQEFLPCPNFYFPEPFPPSPPPPPPHTHKSSAFQLERDTVSSVFDLLNFYQIALYLDCCVRNCELVIFAFELMTFVDGDIILKLVI